MHRRITERSQCLEKKIKETYCIDFDICIGRKTVIMFVRRKEEKSNQEFYD